MLEWLKVILGDAYTEDVDRKISEQIGKNFVARADFNTANEAKKTLNGQIRDRDRQLEALKKSSEDEQALKRQMVRLQEQNKTAQAEYDASLRKVTLDSRIETALLGAKARSTKAVRALLDESRISLDGENVLGLNDQIEALKKDAAYLFGAVRIPAIHPPRAAAVLPPQIPHCCPARRMRHSNNKK